MLLNFFLFITPTLSGSPPAITADKTEESVLDEIEMGTADRDEIKSRPEIKVDFETKEQFKKDYFTSGPDKRQLYDEYLPKLGADWILNWLEILYPACHAHSHELGMAIYARGKDIGLALNECKTKCTSGCMHGVLMEAFGTHSLHEITEKMGNFCKNKEMTRFHKPGNCAHGIGHALMVVTHHDIEKSISGCSSFNNPAMGYYCATGVFMEYFHTWNEEDLNKHSLHFPCDTLTRYSAACYRYKAPKILKKLDGNINTLAEKCLELPRSLRLGCFHGLGTAKVLDIFNDPKLLTDVCHRGNSDDQAMCIEGAIEKLADFKSDKATAACEYLEGENRKLCLAAAHGKMYRLDKPTMGLYIDGSGDLQH